MKQKRIQWIDNLKFLLCISVVIIHVTYTWINGATKPLLSDFRWILNYVIFPILTHFAVPIFLMISGYLLLDPNKEVSIKKMKKYILKILLTLLTFGYFYCILETIYQNNFNLNNPLMILFTSFINLIEAHSWAHLWYLYMLIGIYILLPVFKKFINHSSEEEIKFILTAFFIVGLLIPTINYVFNVNITTFYLEKIFGFAFLFIAGYCIGNNIIFQNRTIYIGGIIGIIGYTTFLLLFKKYNIIIKYDLFLCLYSILVFKLFSSEKLKLPMNKFTTLISKYSFEIYVFHAFFINLLYKFFNIYPSVLPPVIGELTFSACILLLSLMSTYIFSKIPYLNKLFK